MPPPRIELPRRVGRWLGPATLLALVPKCVLCVVGYAGLGTALGLGGPELCGSESGSTLPWTPSLAWLGLAGGIGAMVTLVRRRGGRRATTYRTRPTRRIGLGTLRPSPGNDLPLLEIHRQVQQCRAFNRRPVQADRPSAEQPHAGGRVSAG